ncbi:hypothetical protein GX411_11450 [Candidatus Fermentibacteria bacterium]|nr:hypothetical protein [Candidatus Fermentibacteria bacterium]
MNCEKALKLIDLVLDGEVSESEEHMLHFHIAGCSSCRRALEMGRDFSAVMRQISRPEPPADLEKRVRERLARMKPARRRIPGLPLWSRIAVVIPFAAALLLIIGLGSGGTGTDDSVPEAAVQPDKSVATETSAKRAISTPPMASYVRPASLVAF